MQLLQQAIYKMSPAPSPADCFWLPGPPYQSAHHLCYGSTEYDARTCVGHLTLRALVSGAFAPGPTRAQGVGYIPNHLDRR